MARSSSQKAREPHGRGDNGENPEGSAGGRGARVSGVKEGLLANAADPMQGAAALPAAPVAAAAAAAVVAAGSASAAAGGGSAAPAAPLPTLRSIGAPAESNPKERRASVTPESAQQLLKAGFAVKIAAGAGTGANFPDRLYREAGCELVSQAEALACDVVLKCAAPQPQEIALLKEGALVISFVYPAQNGALLDLLASKKVTLFAVDCVPRVTRAQAFDALSSMANIAGYKAVVEAAHNFGRFLGGQMTAAGRIPPAKVLVIGGGVAGLSAIATARNMGAIVRCFDTRPAVKEQVQSLGGEFLEVTGLKLEEGTGGYAKEMTKEFIEAEMALFAAQAKEVDIIITTALIPGKPAPRLISKEMVESMRFGSVIVDLAAEMGGNVENTRKDEVFQTANGVTIIGYTDLPSRLPTQSSKLYANNVARLLLFVAGGQGAAAGPLTLDLKDEVIRGSVVLYGGEKLWPPPPRAPGLTASAPGSSAEGGAASQRQPSAQAPSPPAAAAAAAAAPPPVDPVALSYRRATTLSLALSLGVLVFAALGFAARDRSFLAMVTVFCLAGTAGYFAVWGVVPSLHTPLMAVTNAISGITAVGGLLLLGTPASPPSFFPRSLALVALLASCVNIAGGFLITKRMLAMFKRPEDPREFSNFYLLPGGLLVALFFLCKLFFSSRLAALSAMAYLAAALACVVSIAALATQKTARFGLNIGLVGVVSGVMVTTGDLLTMRNLPTFLLAALFMMAGSSLGLAVGRAVQVTELPQTVAGFHSLVGLAAMLTSVAHFAEGAGRPSFPLSAVLGAAVGAITLSGSLVAFLKLHGLMRSKPLALPAKNAINCAAGMLQLGVVLLFVNLGGGAAAGGGARGAFGAFGVLDAFGATASGASGAAFTVGLCLLGLTCLLSLFLGFHLVASIGGGDMPVCITVLNSYSGWALVAEGFMLGNSLLTIVGSLIGFSGGILSYIMCVAMNRSLANVLLGGYAAAPAGAARAAGAEHRECSLHEAAELIAGARSVVIVPGYGMAVARAQNAVAEIARLCRKKHIAVKFAIHPVAGRMPGHMNVLLAEAGVPYDWVFEMEEVNDDFAAADVALVVGANDITNSAAEEDPTCAIAGMPVLRVWRAKTCIYMKRTMGAGYADLENPVFYKPNTLMLLGDAKRSTDALVQKIQAYWEV